MTNKPNYEELNLLINALKNISWVLTEMDDIEKADIDGDYNQTETKILRYQDDNRSLLELRQQVYDQIIEKVEEINQE